MNVYRMRGVPARAWPASVQEFAAVWGEWKDAAGVIDFTDMISIALADVAEAPTRPSIIIADEAQDHSRLEYDLLKKWGDAAGALLIAGDPYQSLYTWRGADPEIFFDESIPEDHRRILSQSFRVPGAVHRIATEWISQLSNYRPIEYRPRRGPDVLNGETVPGSVTTCSATWRRPEWAIDEAERYLADGKSVMLVGTCSFQLSPTVAVLRKRGIPFANPWRVTRGDWNPLGGGRRGRSMSSRLLDYLAIDAGTFGDDAQGGWTGEQLHGWSSVLKTAGLLPRGSRAAIKVIADAERLAAENGGVASPAVWGDLLKYFNEEPFMELIDMVLSRAVAGQEPAELDDLLAWWSSRLLSSKLKAARFPLEVAARRGALVLKDAPKCFVGTVHSFKGGEADVVFLFPDVSPAGYREWSLRGTHRDNVIRVFYVGMTRARERLVLCAPASAYSVNLRQYITRDSDDG